ncbi:MAG TPA: glycosyltransferase [Pyrinomonadaceae bacterium]|nr:glycosyltransferase [Pyrinomonadaceae bacterium]
MTVPPVSLVIPVKDEEASVDALLASIGAQTQAVDEVIFVDSASSDRTVALLRNASLGTTPIRVIESGPGSPGKGRNIGISAATNQWVALTDAGIKLDPRWVEELLEVVRRNPELDVVYGNYEPVVDTFFERNAALVYVPAKQERAGEKMRGPSIASCLLRREVWQAVGGFPDLRAAEDLMFMEQVERHPFKIGWAPRATVWWQLRPSLLSTFRRFVLYSRHNVLAGRQKYWHYGIARQYILALIVTLVALVSGIWWLLLAIPLGMLLRVFKGIWSRRETLSGLGLINPLRWVHVLIITLAIDLATFVGWIQAYLPAASRTPIKSQAD